MILNSLQKCVALTAYVSAVLIAVTVGSATLTARADEADGHVVATVEKKWELSNDCAIRGIYALRIEIEGLGALENPVAA